MYFLAINRLKAADTKEGANQWMSEHKDWLNDLKKKKVLIQAGKWGAVGSAILFKAETIEKAHTVLAQDPLMLHDMVDYQMHDFQPEIEIKS